jgi:hypothetical protein
MVIRNNTPILNVGEVAYTNFEISRSKSAITLSKLLI